MSDFTDSLVAMKDATEELTQSKELFETIFDGYQGTLAASIKALHDLKAYAEANGKNVLTVASSAIVSDLTVGDEVNLLIFETNDSTVVSLDVNAQGAKNIVNVTAANQLFAGALVKVRYDGTAFYVVEQINPKTGNPVSDIGKLVTDTTDMLSIGEVALNGAELNRDEFAIAWAKIKNTSNLIDQAAKDADPVTYGGYWGQGDGSTTFTLPIVGGEFIRMFDDVKGIDSDRIFGSFQEDTLQEHKHYIGSDHSDGGVDNMVATQDGNSSSIIGRNDVGDRGDTYIRVEGIKNARASEETRPRSIAYYGKTRL